ncbi:ABC transporter permease [Staphylococcus condimenti]|uniref:ABC transporter permease n=1 Tax=Staphylococcus condimenti TaxID=70255 RepID=A0A4Q7CKL3_9STAP|nr:nickel/cobalt ABC transporter permease [Staphylococcus condimenti]RZI00890.1 ABC transporter permease [Staphylococcus condimenti]RZI01661.1 ABC transporter permease [Staphylococcus condimenti]
MSRYILKRMMLTLPLLLLISFLTFILTHLTKEDPAVVILHAQEVPNVTPELIKENRAQYGLDKPFLMQYWDWLWSILHLDWGTSYVTHEEISSRLGPAFINTLKLTLVSSIVVIVCSIILGTLTALCQNTWFDRFARSASFIVTAMPLYWLASILIIYISVKMNLLPTSGLLGWTSYILPAGTIALAYTGIYFRNVRSAMIQQMSEEYILYARAMGVPYWRIVLSAMRNAMQVVVSIFCMSIPLILGSSVIIENVFAWPGMGQLSVKAVLNQDFPMIQAYVLIVSCLFVIFNTLSDIINLLMNPRLRGELQ